MSSVFLSHLHSDKGFSTMDSSTPHGGVTSKAVGFRN